MGLSGFKGQPALDGADRPKEVWIFEPDDFVGHGFFGCCRGLPVVPAMPDQGLRGPGITLVVSWCVV